jgi:hypothetical protein
MMSGGCASPWPRVGHCAVEPTQPTVGRMAGMELGRKAKVLPPGHIRSPWLHNRAAEAESDLVRWISI